MNKRRFMRHFKIFGFWTDPTSGLSLFFGQKFFSGGRVKNPKIAKPSEFFLKITETIFFQ